MPRGSELERLLRRKWNDQTLNYICDILELKPDEELGIWMGILEKGFQDLEM